jgi:hypothetical protein
MPGPILPGCFRRFLTSKKCCRNTGKRTRVFAAENRANIRCGSKRIAYQLSLADMHSNNNRAATGLAMETERTQSERAADYETAVAEFIRSKGVTRCPTACVLPTQGAVAAADREALEEHAERRDRLRKAKIAVRAQQFWGVEAIGPVPR